MPTLDEMRDYVLTTALDTTLTMDGVDALINEALLAVSERVLLPELQTSAGVVALSSAASIPLPGDFHRSLFGCQVVGVDHRPIILTTKRQLLARHPHLEEGMEHGTILHVWAGAQKLWYAFLPLVNRPMRIEYYRVPTPLVSGGQVPDCLPAGLQRRLLGTYALREIFDTIEEGVEGNKINTKRYEEKFEAAISELETFVGGQNRPSPPRDRKSWL